jgi:dTDP-4-dehydrorhamnose 3,5-epimerase
MKEKAMTNQSANTASRFKKIDTALPGVILIEPPLFGDERGFFTETYNRRDFSALGIEKDFVQDNHSRSRKGVLRGLHYQLGRPQAKLVRVIRGEVYDVAVDARKGSPTFGKWIGEILSEDNRRQMYIPEGFAHGFCVISDVAEFCYKCSDFWAPEEERGVIWSDPALSIDWPLDGADPILSARDSGFGPLSDLPENHLPAYGQ